MPIYVYGCPNCGSEREFICSHSRRPKYIKCDCRADGILPTLMLQKVSSGSFIINGFNEKNGYSGEKWNDYLWRH